MEELNLYYNHHFHLLLWKIALFYHAFIYFITKKLIYKFYLFIIKEGKKGNNFKHGKKWLVALIIVLFAVNALKFLNSPESEIPIVSILFNLIIYLAIIIIILHNNEINFEVFFKNDSDKNSDNDNIK